MKIQLRKPAQTRERYTDQYKREALELWRNSGRSAAEVATELGIRPPLLYRWARRQQVAKTKNASTGGESKERMEELERENQQLRQENAKLLEQREVLKKSLGILSEVPHRGMPESKR